MKENFQATINESSPLISDDLVRRVGKLSSSLFADAMAGSGVMDFRIKPVRPNTKVVGTALTVSMKPGDNLFLHKAVFLSRQGYVLVADGKGYTGGAAWGEMMTRAAMARGAEGVVLDGLIRDCTDLVELGFPVFSKGAVPSGVTRLGPGSINSVISCGGVPVHPGDLVVGDDDGVVVVSRDKIEQALSQAEEKLAQEEKRIQEIGRENPEPAWVGEGLKSWGL